ncbi:hypothetical protein N7532_001233 [Penicillium argentinense]|uniref:FAD/NAD(P)-binding domain-containing protein n=1 Tax=Penicillium argentinense TaxID=1131581 RepID=A0A9W9KM91_9EURO|nr:uncharacterized protein N7532_001233 [Penicillium argentinense]KAJ5110698.1 hypothetical protein N7532_001233 [Penicillium argentinense]
MVSEITVVVIGAAVAGIKVSHGVLKHIPTAKIVLVNPHKDYYFHIAAPRVVVKPDAFSADQYFYPIQDTFKKYPESSFETIIVGGGGTVGVELAGELSDALLGKNDSSPSITLVSATPHLLPRLKDAAGAAAERILKEKGVKLLASRKVEKAEQNLGSNVWTVILDTGEVLTADLYVAATGLLPNNGFIPSAFLDKDGWVDVDDQLRVRAAVGADGNSAIYAVGDVTTFPRRDGYRIAEQASVVVSNIKSEITGIGQRTSYTPSDRIVAMVPVGRSGGTGQMGSWVLWGFLVSFIKGRDFFVSKASSFVQG